MSHTKSIVVGLSLLFAASLAQAQVNSGSALIDSGKFRFYETKQIRGEETYQINQFPNGDLIVQAKTDMPFAQQENKPLVNATLRTAKDLTPQSFAIKGPTLLDLEEATSITLQGKTARIQDRGQNKSVQVPHNFFTMSGYVPLSVEMMLIRYWLAHGLKLDSSAPASPPDGTYLRKNQRPIMKLDSYAPASPPDVRRGSAPP